MVIVSVLHGTNWAEVYLKTANLYDVIAQNLLVWLNDCHAQPCNRYPMNHAWLCCANAIYLPAF